MSKNTLRKFLALLLGTACVATFAAVGCGGDETPPDDEKDPPVVQTKTYTVTFNANGGTLTGSGSVEVKEDEKISGAPTAAKEGYTFNGWYTAATGGTKIELSTYEVTGDVTLYAQYTQNSTPGPDQPGGGEEDPDPDQPGDEDTVTITFDANGGTLTGEATYEIEAGTSIISGGPEATRDGYKFDGWYDNADCEGTEVVPDFDYFEEDTTLYAKWNKVYTVTFDAGEGTLTGSGEIKVEAGQLIVGAPTAALNGNEFYGWYTAETGGERVDFESYKVSEDVTLYAHYGLLTMPIKNLKDHEGNPVGYRIEAEVSKIEGTLNSENAAGTGFIENNQATASGNTSVGYFAVPGNTMTFTFYAEEAGTAEIAVRAASNNTQMDFSAGFNIWVDDQVVTEADVTFTLNGEPAHFESANLRGAGKDMPMTWNYYWDPISIGEVEILEGMNTLVVTAMSDKTPNMDCLDIETDIVLTSVDGTAASGEAQQPAPPAPEVAYEGDLGVNLIVGSYEGGPAVQKAIIDFGSTQITKTALASNPLVATWGSALGTGNGDKQYLSDAEGNELKEATQSQYVTIEYAVSYGQWSFNGNLSPFVYQTVNNWKPTNTIGVDIDGTLTIGDVNYTSVSGKVTAEIEVPDLEVWDLTGKSTTGDITLTYGSYGTQAMKDDGKKNPLVIWLHGAGEGGTDPSINILGNQVTNLAKPLIQNYFIEEDGIQGAYVLAPQTPTAWMDKDGSGEYGTEEASQYYVAALKALIDEYIEANGDIDMNRIYIGGCSNGGFMTVNMIINYSDFFAAAYPICEAYDAKWLTDEAVESIKDLPIWFTHSANDNTVSIYNKESAGWWAPATPTTPQDAYTNNLYIKLINAGATNVHYSLFQSVTVNGVNYDGHWSWIYTLRDECSAVQPTTGAGEQLAITDIGYDKNTNKVQVGGEDVTLWGWLAAQVKAAE